MVINALRDIGGFIDKAIYWFVELLLQLILDLADTQIFSQSVITEFANRIYIILGLVMLFKIIISFIQILINPDKMDDKEQGVGNILMRVVISLLLIVLVPSIFSLARQLQSYIIPIIPKVVLGTEAGSTDGDMMNTSGRAMAFYSYTAFFTYNNPECNDGSIYGTGNDPTNVTVYDVPSAVKNINEKCPDSSDENGYRYKYDWPMSMIVGIYLVFMLVQIAVAVAIRAIKLGICEFIAPIPIASYIDPKTSKQAFDNWVSTSIKTYLDLFTRLIVVYFVVFVFMIIVADETFDTILASVGGDTTRQALVVIAIIIGLLQFAKQSYKFISDMLGVKEGMGDIGGMFRGEGLKGIAGALGTVGAAVGSGIGNARYAWQNRDKNHNIRSLFSAGARGLAGAGAATVRGGLAVANGKGWRAAFKDNIATTTGNSHRRVNAKALAKISQEEYETAVADIKSKGLSHDEEKKAIAALPRPIQPRMDKFRAVMGSWQGLETINGQAYSNASSVLSSARSELFTGEAMKKLDEEGSKLDGIRHKYTVKDLNNNKTLDVGLNYSQLKTAFDQVANGAATVDLNGMKIDASTIREHFKTAQKRGAIDYVNAALGKEIKDDFGNKYNINNIKNTTIDEGMKQLVGAISGLNINPSEKKVLQEQLAKDPGQFLKSISDTAKQYQTTGTRRSAYEREQKKNN